MSERWQTQSDTERDTLLNAFYLKYERAVKKRDELKKIRLWSLLGASYTEAVSLVAEYTDGGFGIEQEVLTGFSVAGLAAAGIAEYRLRKQEDAAFSAERHIIQLESERDE